MKVAIPFFWGGGMSEEVETLGEASPPLNDVLPKVSCSFPIP